MKNKVNKKPTKRRQFTKKKLTVTEILKLLEFAIREGERLFELIKDFFDYFN